MVPSTNSGRTGITRNFGCASATPSRWYSPAIRNSADIANNDRPLCLGLESLRHAPITTAEQMRDTT